MDDGSPAGAEVAPRERASDLQSAPYAQTVDGACDTWTFPDVWVFAAIGTHRRRCSLVEVIAAAGWINHAVLLEGEVASALKKLVGSGLVWIFDDWTFELTDEGAGLLEDSGHSLAEQLRLIDAQLRLIEPKLAPVKLPEGAMDRAVAQYLEAAR